MPAPSRTPPSRKWPHEPLWQRVRKSLAVLPGYFRSETTISGIEAPDIFTLSGALGATIEKQVVETLNSMRPVWDPDGTYREYWFVRQPQTFPDVLLRKSASDVLFGIELKGWYLLAHEGEPNLRFGIDPAACAPPDMIAVVPWALSNVLSGVPVVFDPFVELATYAAEQRNYWWSEVRETKGSREIRRPPNPHPYPSKDGRVVDVPAEDSGNFGRLARVQLKELDDYVVASRQTDLCGIPAESWLDFFKKYARGAKP